MTQGELPAFLWEVTRQLRRRRLQLGVDDYDALRRALAEGFGLSSYEELCGLCVTLWAKSREEAEIVRAAFARSNVEPWEPPSSDSSDAVARVGSRPAENSVAAGGRDADGDPALTKPVADLATSPPPTGVVDRSLVLGQQYPLTEREVAQVWRRLRRPLRTGPAVEIDVATTVERRSRHGVATPPVLVPQRRNTAKLLLLIDRYGSMTPFHGYVGHVVRAIRNAGRIDNVREVYFHDLPGSVSDRSVLGYLDDPFRPDLDLILPLIEPISEGRVYNDPELTMPRSLTAILDELTKGTATVVISDAGAARQRLNTLRLLDTVAFLKTLHSKVGTVTWLNPVRPDNWLHSTAGQVARYIPMYDLTKEGLNHTVDTLRGRPTPVERPL